MYSISRQKFKLSQSVSCDDIILTYLLRARSTHDPLGDAIVKGRDSLEIHYNNNIKIVDVTSLFGPFGAGSN